MRRRRLLRIGAVGAVALTLAACSGGSDGPRARPGSGSPVLEVARSNDLDRFLRAVERAGLTETLTGSGPFTLFAPTDAAFASSSAQRLDPDALRALLAYHVVPGQLTTDFLEGIDVNHTTLLGSSLNIDGTDGLRVNDARVLRADLLASNGVVFVIDRVLTPR